MLGPRVWILAHAVEGKWSNLVGARGVDVHLFTKTIRVKQQRPGPSLRQRRQLTRLERQRQLITRPRDHKHVIRREQQLAHIAFARVVAGHHLPRRRKRDVVVVVTERLSTIRRVLQRKSTPAQLCNRRIEPRQLYRKFSGRSIDEDLVPVDAHVRDDPHLATVTQKLSRQIRDDSLRPSNRDADAFDHRAPLSLLVFHLQRGQRQALSALRRGKVVAGPRVVSPASQQQTRVRRITWTKLQRQLVIFRETANR